MLKTWVEDGKTWAKTADLVKWHDNPRDITRQAFDELITSLKQGLLHNIVVNQDGVVLGGNMRLSALQEMNIENAWVEVVQTNSVKEMFDIAMRSNMSSGFIVEEKLTKLAVDLELTPVELKYYKVHLGEAKPLDLLVNGPDFDDEDGGGDEKEPELKDTFQVIVECRNETEQQATFEKLEQEGYQCRVLTL